MTHSFTLVCNKESELGTITLVTDEKSVQITQTKTFYFKHGHELKIYLSAATDNSEVVEMSGSHEVFLMGTSVCHCIKLESDMKVEPIFRKKPTHRSEFGFITLEVSGQGSVELVGDECNHIQSGDSIRVYSIRQLSTFQLHTLPKDRYKLDFIKSDHTQYETSSRVVFSNESTRIRVGFIQTETETDNLETDYTKLHEPTYTKEYSNTQTGSLGFRNISSVIYETSESPATPTPSKNVDIFNSYDFAFSPRHTPDLAGDYTINGNPLHDIILYRNFTYEFNSLADRAAFEFLLPNLELYSDENNKSCVFTQNNSLIFTPTHETPNELFLRTMYRHDRVVRVHVMNSAFYGNAMSASYLTDSHIKFSDTPNEIATTTNGLGEIVVGETPKFVSMFCNLGRDQVTGVPGTLEYTNSTGCTQLNALTTIFSEVYTKNNLDVHEINSLFTKVLSLESGQNVCGDDPIQKILDGDLRYVQYHKVVILTDALLNVGKLVGKYDVIKTKLANRYIKDRLVVFNGDEFLNEILDNLVTKSLKIELVNVLRNLFSYAINIDVESAFHNWYKLFAFHYTLHQFYLPQIQHAHTESDTTGLISEWDKFNVNLNVAFATINKLTLPSEVVISECSKCKDSTKNFNTLFDTMKLTLSEEKYVDITANQTTMSENTFRMIYDRSLKVAYSGEESCYSVSRNSVNYYDSLTSVDTYTLTHDYAELTECVNELSLNGPVHEEVEFDGKPVFKFSMIESGNSKSMLDCEIQREDLLVEYLGKGEYRIYVDQQVLQGNSLKTSPGYIKIPREYATSMQQHYIKVGYQSGVEVQTISKVTNNRKSVRVVTTYWSHKSDKLVCVLANAVNLKPGNSVTFSNSSVDNLNGTFEVVDIISDTVFSINFTIPTNDSTEYVDITSTIEIESGVKVYCDISDFSVGDMVLFSGHTNYPTSIVKLSSDEYGNYIVVSESFAQTPIYVVKSHAIEVRDEVIDFMYTQKQIYYETTNSDYVNDRIWLTYDPDSDPNGRLHQKVSYIQLFYNKVL